MTIVLDGTANTISGLAVGGLPDATVQVADLATEAKPIGEGQTWQTVTRTSGATYTNSTGRPIMAFVTFTAASSSSIMNIVIGGVGLSGFNQSVGLVGNASIIIPSGSTYSFTVIGTGSSMAVQELR
jgi:hypothetical protein